MKNLLFRTSALAILFLALILSCSKSNDKPANDISGTWVFTHQVVFSYAYPSVLTQPYPISTSNWATTYDSIRIHFDGAGNYSFLNFRWPVDQGKYTIAQDSFLIIKPDTADFIKFNYMLPGFSAYNGTDTIVLPTSPYAGFKFSSDTLLFKKSGNDIVFSGAWFTRANAPVIPSNDTIMLNQSASYFKKQ